jgi:DHA2 family multidrug resistance protein-like MFS transporter
MHQKAPERAGRREWLGLAVLALPALLLALDLSVLYLALPRLSEDLGSNSVQQLWITDIYGFMVAGFLVTMGTLGDRIGRRKLLLIGATAFAASSVLAAFSGSTWMLIAARALMGVAGATLAPSTLALISNMFRDPKQRGTAVAVYVSCFMGGAALGPVVGGLLLQWFWWGSVFLLGVPVMVLLLIAGPLLLPEYRDESAGRLDLVSVVLSLLAILPFIYGVKEFAKDGVGLVPVIAVVAGLGFGTIFVRRQRGLASPLLDLRLFGNRAFSAALVILMFGVATQGGVMLLVSQYLQTVLALSPMTAGLWLVPSSLAMVVGAQLAPHLAHRLHPGWVITGGMAVAAVGYTLLVFVPSTGGLPLLVAGAVVVFLGIGLMSALANNLIVGSVSPRKAGSAAALAQTSGDFGIAFGVAAIGSIGTAVYTAHLTGPGTEVARNSITDAITVAGRLPGAQGADLLARARDGFTSGLNIAAGASAVLVLALAVLAVFTLRRGSEAGEDEPGTDAPAPPAETVRAAD